jgi:predicted transporter
MDESDIMTEITSLILIGVVISVLILAVKSGLGCGLSNLKRKEVFYIAASYFAFSIFIGFLILAIPFESTQKFLGFGLLAHVIMAIGMIWMGLHTIKEWESKKRDVSRRAFLWLSVPCPACLVATFLACFMLTEFADFNDFLVGPAVGALFFVGITVTAFSSNKFSDTPSTLGNVMMFIGLFSYIQSKSVTVSEIPMELDKIAISLIFMVSFILIGFFGRTKWKSHLQ